MSPAAAAGRALGAACLVLSLAAACGREDVLLVSSAAATDAAALPEGSSNNLGDGMPGLRAACPDASVRSCLGLGETCATADDCCSDRCEGGQCIPAGCGPPGTACAGRDQCCSGLCEPVPGTANRACLGYCKRAGEACKRAQDCCSLACLSGACAAGVCGRTGDNCAGDGDCCSGRCVTGRCALDTTLACRPSGEDCNSGGGAPCCGACNKVQRCDVGPGPCRAPGAPCTVAADCCAGTCAVSGGGGMFCTSACVADGATCTTSADCCAGSCTGAPSTCRTMAIACKLLGVDCTKDAECCSSQCLGGRCGDNCSGPR